MVRTERLPCYPSYSSPSAPPSSSFQPESVLASLTALGFYSGSMPGRGTRKCSLCPLSLEASAQAAISSGSLFHGFYHSVARGPRESSENPTVCLLRAHVLVLKLAHHRLPGHAEPPLLLRPGRDIKTSCPSFCFCEKEARWVPLITERMSRKMGAGRRLPGSTPPVTARAFPLRRGGVGDSTLVGGRGSLKLLLHL